MNKNLNSIKALMVIDVACMCALISFAYVVFSSFN
jgi:hypothetical protein